MIEVRWHGRGGQGAVTSAELLAQAAISEGKYAQAFPSFGPERRGAPVLSFVRISPDKPIRMRSGVTEPDFVAVLDPSLLRIVNVSAGLKAGGTIIINTTKTAEQIQEEFGITARIGTVDATRIAMELLGVPITNTTMIGAVLKAIGIVKIESLLEPVKHRFGRNADKNIEAMKRAFGETKIKEMSVAQ